MATITLYVLRHGETDWNAEKRYQGQVDIPMNVKGRDQAKRNGRTLKKALANPEEYDFLASPLSRARETMEIVRSELALPIHGYRLDDQLKELSYGHWQGKLQHDLPKLDPAGLSARNLDPFRWRPDAGESYADLLKRVSTWADTIKRDSVVVTHGGVSRCLRGYFLDLPDETIPQLEVPQDKVLVIRRGHMHWL